MTYHTLTDYGPGKFHKRVDEIAYVVSTAGCCEEAGDVSEHGLWYGLVTNFTVEPPFADVGPVELGKLTEDELAFLRAHRAFILQEDSQGFIEVNWYVDGEAAGVDWVAVRKWEDALSQEVTG